MSDQATPPGGAGPQPPERPRRDRLSDRRASETVMLNSDAVQDVVAQAKSGVAPEDVTSPGSPPSSTPPAPSPPAQPAPAQAAPAVEPVGAGPSAVPSSGSGPRPILLVAIAALVLVVVVVVGVMILTFAS